MKIDEINQKPSPDFSVLRKVLLREGTPPYVPLYELFADLQVMRTVTGKAISTPADTIEFYYRCGYDYVPAWPSYYMKIGNLIDTRQPYPISDRESFDKHRWPEADEIGMNQFNEIGSALPDGMKIIAQTGGPFEMAEALFGYENLCYMLADDPTLVSDVFDRIGKLYRDIYTKFVAQEKVGAVVISDDLGFKTQTLIDVASLKKYVFPIYHDLAEIIHAHDLPCILHSCGNLSEIMDDLISNVKIDAKHSYEDTILPVEEAKRMYGDRIAILGGFDLDKLCRGTPESVLAYAGSLIGMGKSGGYALGSGNSIAAYVPPGNYLAMISAAHAYRHVRHRIE